MGCPGADEPQDAGLEGDSQPEIPDCPVGLWHRAVVPCAQFFPCDTANAPEECSLGDCLVSRVLGYRADGDFLTVSLLWSAQERRYSAAQPPDIREWTVENGTLFYDGVAQGAVTCVESKVFLDGVTQGEPLDVEYEDAVWHSWDEDAWADVAY